MMMTDLIIFSPFLFFSLLVFYSEPWTGMRMEDDSCKSSYQLGVLVYEQVVFVFDTLVSSISPQIYRTGYLIRLQAFVSIPGDLPTY